MDAITRSTCPYCGVGCGVEVVQTDGGEIEIRGDRQHPANEGRLCSKGAALGDTLATDRNRLLQPRVNGEVVSWGMALDAVAERWRGITREHGADAVAFYASGQMLTEDYYVANKLMKGFIGTANIDTNSRLCMSSAVAGHVRAFGADTVACSYQDLEATDLLILVGSNLAWCHPVLYQRVKRARGARDDMRVVVIDPRRTDSCEIADLHLPIAPDADVALFNGLLALLHRAGKTDADYIASHTMGFDDVAESLDTDSVESLAAQCGLEAGALQTLVEWLSSSDSTVTAFSMGVNQSRSGTDKVNAIINLHLALGRIGKPGSGPFSITGQPNAMGGREVGGLATTLASHMGFSDDNCDRVQRFWDSPGVAREPGLKALDLFEAIERGEVRSVWIMATNPLFSLPDAERWRRALERCECVIVSDCVDDTDTLAAADICLPALGWGEKTGTVTNSERCISRQRAFLPAPGEAKPDWWAICEVARRLGFEAAFPYAGVEDIFAEHAALSGFENAGSRDFDISALAGQSSSEYQAMEPVRWPLEAERASPDVFRDGRYFHDDQRARFVAVSSAAVNTPSLVLNTGRVRDHWHSMTRTARAARLCDHMPEPVASAHPEDAQRAGLTDGGLARISSAFGSALVRVRCSEQQSPGQVFVPMHWSRRFSSAANINAVVAPAVDPISGEPAFKLTAVEMEPVATAWSGVFFGRSAAPPPLDYWVRVPGENLERYLLVAGRDSVTPEQLADAMLPAVGRKLCLSDSTLGLHRWVVLDDDGALLAAMSVGPGEIDADQAWMAGLFERSSLTADEQRWALAGLSPDPGLSQGRLVCSCKRVGELRIRELVREGCTTTSAITSQCEAGGGCGSCVPELQAIIDREQSTCRFAS